MWPAHEPVTVADPASLRFTNGQLITFAYVPAGASVLKPSVQTISIMQELISGTSTSTTTAPGATTTTAPGATTTTPTSSTSTTPSATTTIPSTTTTAPSTTTTKPSTTTTKP